MQSNTGQEFNSWNNNNTASTAGSPYMQTVPNTTVGNQSNLSTANCSWQSPAYSQANLNAQRAAQAQFQSQVPRQIHGQNLIYGQVASQTHGQGPNYSQSANPSYNPGPNSAPIGAMNQANGLYRAQNMAQDKVQGYNNGYNQSQMTISRGQSLGQNTMLRAKEQQALGSGAYQASGNLRANGKTLPTALQYAQSSGQAPCNGNERSCIFEQGQPQVVGNHQLGSQGLRESLSKNHVNGCSQVNLYGSSHAQGQAQVITNEQLQDNANSQAQMNANSQGQAIVNPVKAMMAHTGVIEGSKLNSADSNLHLNEVSQNALNTMDKNTARIERTFSHINLNGAKDNVGTQSSANTVTGTQNQANQAKKRGYVLKNGYFYPASQADSALAKSNDDKAYGNLSLEHSQEQESSSAKEDNFVKVKAQEHNLEQESSKESLVKEQDAPNLIEQAYHELKCKTQAHEASKAQDVCAHANQSSNSTLSGPNNQTLLSTQDQERTEQGKGESSGLEDGDSQSCGHERGCDLEQSAYCKQDSAAKSGALVKDVVVLENKLMSMTLPNTTHKDMPNGACEAERHHSLDEFNLAKVINLGNSFDSKQIELGKCFKDEHLSFDSFKLPVFDKCLNALIPKKNESYFFNEENLNLVLRHLQNNHGDSLYISGPTGCGKTSFILEVAARLQWPIESVTLSQNSEIADLIGHNILRKGQLVFEYGPLSRAMMFGEILLLNEIDLMSAGELAALNDVLEGRALCVNANNGEVIHPHPFFRVIATANSKGAGDSSGHYAGVRKQNKAFLDRWVFVEFNYLNCAQEQELLLKSIANINPDLIKYFVVLAQELRFSSGIGAVKSNQDILDEMKQHIEAQYKSYAGSLDSLVANSKIPDLKELVAYSEPKIGVQGINLGALDELCQAVRPVSTTLSVPFSTRALLRIARYYVQNPQLSIGDAVKQGFASRLESNEFAFVMRMTFEVFGYDSDFYKLPRTIDDIERYIVFRKANINKHTMDRILLSEEQLRNVWQKSFKLNTLSESSLAHENTLEPSLGADLSKDAPQDEQDQGMVSGKEEQQAEPDQGEALGKDEQQAEPSLGAALGEPDDLSLGASKEEELGEGSSEELSAHEKLGASKAKSKAKSKSKTNSLKAAVAKSNGKSKAKAKVSELSSENEVIAEDKESVLPDDKASPDNSKIGDSAKESDMPNKSNDHSSKADHDESLAINSQDKADKSTTDTSLRSQDSNDMSSEAANEKVSVEDQPEASTKHMSKAELRKRAFQNDERYRENEEHLEALRKIVRERYPAFADKIEIIHG